MGHVRPVVDKVPNNPHHVGVGSLYEVVDIDLRVAVVGIRRVGAVDCDNQRVGPVADAHMQVAVGHSSHHQGVELKDSDWLN